MPFLIPGYEDIKSDLLRDIANQLPDAALGADSDFNARAAAMAASVEGLYQHQAWALRQVFPDTADTDYLERHCSLRGITRKPAVAAVGTILFSGTPGVTVPAGTQVKSGDGQLYTNTLDGVIGGGGTISVAAAASAVGAAGNQPNSTACTLVTAPAGVLSDALLETMSGGVDIETDVAMAARLLDLLRSPPAGGNAADYKRWALEVPGISHAFVFSLRRGNGTVDIAVLVNGAPASLPKRTQVQALIDTRRPVGLQGTAVQVTALTTVSVAVTATLGLSGVSLTDATAMINAALKAYFSTLAPGDTVYKSRISAIISDTPGVVDFTLTAPSANVVTLVDSTHFEFPTLGTVTLT